MPPRKRAMTSTTSLVNHPQAHTLIQLIAPYVCTDLENAITFETALKGKHYDFSSEIARHGYRRIWKRAPRMILEFARKKYHMELPIPIEYLTEVYQIVCRKSDLPRTSAKDKVLYYVRQLMMEKKAIKKHTFTQPAPSCNDVYPCEFRDIVSNWQKMYDKNDCQVFEIIDGACDDQDGWYYEEEEKGKGVLNTIITRWCNIFHRISFLLGQDLREDDEVLSKFEITELERKDRLAAALEDANVLLLAEPNIIEPFVEDGFGSLKDLVEEAVELYFLYEQGEIIDTDSEEVKMEAFEKILEGNDEDSLNVPPSLTRKYEQYLNGEPIVNKRREYQRKREAERRAENSRRWRARNGYEE